MDNKKRIVFLYVIIGTIFTLIASRLVELQVVKGDEYRDASETKLVRSVPLKAPRGEIFDRYGRPLVTNRMGFSIVFYKDNTTKNELNQLILNVLNVMQDCGDNYEDTFPFSLTEPPQLIFSGSDSDAIERNKKTFYNVYKLKLETSDDGVFDFLLDEFDIPEDMPYLDKRRIMSIRHYMTVRQFGVTTPFTLATDVSMDTVTRIKENQSDFPGVNILTEPIRQYSDSTLAAHLIGRVGLISKEEYDAAQEKGIKYGYNDIVGKDNLEQYLEEYLRGVDGMSAVSQTRMGKTSTILESREPVPGNYAVLTIDTELQRALEHSLEKTIQNLRRSKDSKDASCGAAVVIDVNTGEVLAMASYPSYDPAQFHEDYQDHINDPLKPMWNRAIAGTYAPGSTFKMVTAIAGLEEGHTTVMEKIKDEGMYKFYPDYQPKCWIYTDTGGTHGMQDVTDALKNSCNYYFYEIARRMEIGAIDKYAEMFGLGKRTEVELKGEASGILASPEYRQKIKSRWFPGDTLQAAIGQSDNLFTPIQLANYTATLANGGTRYRPHLVKSIKSYETSEPVQDYSPIVEGKIEMNPKNYKAVMDGMLAASQSGTASNVFSNYSMPVGSKTGTASVPKGTANGLFVAFAPFDNPQIAIAAVVEHGGHGNFLGEIAADVFDAYFKLPVVEDPIQQDNVLR